MRVCARTRMWPRHSGLFPPRIESARTNFSCLIPLPFFSLVIPPHPVLLLAFVNDGMRIKDLSFQIRCTWIHPLAWLPNCRLTLEKLREPLWATAKCKNASPARSVSLWGLADASLCSVPGTLQELHVQAPSPMLSLQGRQRAWEGRVETLEVASRGSTSCVTSSNSSDASELFLPSQSKR